LIHLKSPVHSDWLAELILRRSNFYCIFQIITLTSLKAVLGRGFMVKISGFIYLIASGFIDLIAAINI